MFHYKHDIALTKHANLDQLIINPDEISVYVVIQIMRVTQDKIQDQQEESYKKTISL